MMDPHHILCEDTSFDLFSKPPTEGAIQEINDQEIAPLTALSSTSGSVEFNVSGDGEEYIDLSDLRLHLRVKVENADGTTPLADDDVELVNLWPQALFRQCDLFLNGVLATTSSSMYPYTAYITTLLSFPHAVKKHSMNVLEHLDGWKVKTTQKENEAMIRLHLPLCHQQRLIPNGVELKLRLLRSPPEFIFKRKAGSTKTFKISLEKCSLFIRRITPSATLLLEHSEHASKMNMVYPIERLFPRFFTLTQGTREFDLNNISQGQLPSRVIVGLVKSTSFSGSLDSDPFKFEPFTLNHISLLSNGRAYPSVPLTADFSKDFCRRAYYTLLESLQGPCLDNESIGLSLDEFKTKSCFFAFTLQKSLNGPNQSLPRRETGYLNAKLRFENNLTENINAIFILEYHNYIEIDSARNVYLDYAA
jgi:hypothetical protein